MDSPRKAAYEALLTWKRSETFILHSLSEWQATSRPEARDFALAYEIAAGVVRRWRTLDASIDLLTSKRVKARERVLLALGLYQLWWMHSVPPHAALNETVQLAKSCIHASAGPFVNAVMRRALADGQPVFSEPGLHYSLPDHYVGLLRSELGDRATACMEHSLSPPPLMLRVRADLPADLTAQLGSSDGLPDGMYRVDGESIPQLAHREEVYIQNATPFALLSRLRPLLRQPSQVLDLCAAPGGKLIALHDFFPSAELFANDVSEQKLAKLRSNLTKYGIDCTFFCGPGQELPKDRNYDLIICDVPCSNSGVLGKRPEARWRLEPHALAELLSLQRSLLRHAADLLAPGGQLCYMTCSILCEENEGMLDWACEELGLTIQSNPELLLPNAEGWDGGFAGLLERPSDY
ncbi:MAG: methyltransferase domain-containing protein [Chlamydiia bacterium]|nr:methyltransferase domain-containing protein [Chlamydiia bacterium]